MKRVIKNNYKFIIGIIVGLIISVSSVYAIEAYIESNKVAYNKHNKTNVEEAIDELYERSGIHKEKWVDKTLNGADPVLKEPLIPVEIKPNGDVYYANLNSEWYNYSEKRWANAIILVDNPSNTNYAVGDHIIEKDIESYFVWIPRYQYKIWNLANTEEYKNVIDTSNFAKEDFFKFKNAAITIDIKFGNVSAIPKMNESEAKLNEYYTHPAFTLGNKDLNGIWVGKFETGYKGAISTITAEVNEEEPTSIIIKPDVYSWRRITARNIFMTSYNYKNNSNNHNNTLDPHMLKNTEWGAIVYLSNSEYGINNEVNINNANDYKTGYSSYHVNQNTYGGIGAKSTDKTRTQPWNSSTGYLASSTGNITGVYDMSGGAGEIMASCMEGIVGNSEFTVEELANYMLLGYIDKYSADSTPTSYDKRILGDATGEMGPFYKYYENNGSPYNHGSWYNDFASFIGSSWPMIHRGGMPGDGSIAGPLYFAGHTGDNSTNIYGFRIALAAK